MSLNRVILIGNLTREPEIKYTPAGAIVAQMGIAVNRRARNDQGQWEDVPDFFNLVAWEKRAEYAQNYLHKGNRIAIEGRLQTRSWVDQATGQKRTAFEIVVDNIQSLTSRADSEASIAEPSGGDYGAPSAPAPAARPAAPARATAAPARTAPPPIEDDSDEADPFADE